ncbi:hypothetical protein EON70_00565 [bacterium]|nr:MAG: hypothetical protein EON70_00565 [bacterium]
MVIAKTLLNVDVPKTMFLVRLRSTKFWYVQLRFGRTTVPYQKRSFWYGTMQKLRFCTNKVLVVHGFSFSISINLK